MKVGETGITFRVGASYDMSSETELELTFTKPDATTVTKSQTGGEVTLGTSAVTDSDLGALSANEYVEYEIESGFLDTAGTWKVYLTYTNTTPTPDDVFIGDCVEFEVTTVCQ